MKTKWRANASRSGGSTETPWRENLWRKRKENWRRLLLGIQTGDKLAKPPFFAAYSRLCRHCRNGHFQKISIPNHGRLACFNTPLPSEIPKCVTPPCPQNSMIVNPPSPSEFPFFWKYIFDLATPIWTNEHEFMPPQGCDLAAPGDKLYSSVTRKTYR